MRIAARLGSGYLGLTVIEARPPVVFDQYVIQ
jgi:hypothetical protein